MTKKKILFKPGTMHGNVVLNFRNSPESEFGHYAEEFHNAGKLLAQRIKRSRNYSDLQACPIVFLYRHALELYLKDIVMVGNWFIQSSGATPIVKTEDIGSHGLARLAPALKQAFDTVGWDWKIDVAYMKTEKEFEVLLKEIDAIDPLSQSFRYPTKRNGEASVSKHFLFSILEFSKTLDPILDMLDSASAGLRAQWDNYAEALYESQHV